MQDALSCTGQPHYPTGTSQARCHELRSMRSGASAPPTGSPRETEPAQTAVVARGASSRTVGNGTSVVRELDAGSLEICRELGPTRGARRAAVRTACLFVPKPDLACLVPPPDCDCFCAAGCAVRVPLLSLRRAVSHAPADRAVPWLDGDGRESRGARGRGRTTDRELGRQQSPRPCSGRGEN